MSGSTKEIPLMGEGTAWIAKKSDPHLLRDIGQASVFKVEVAQESKKLRNSKGGGGTAAQVDRITDVSLSITLHDFSPENLAMALFGQTADLPTSSVTNQSHTAYSGALLPLSGVGPSEVTVTVDPSAWAATTAKTVGAIVKPGTGAHFYQCTVAGTTGADEPATWPTDGTTVTDGTVTWQDMGTMVLATGEFQIESAGLSFPGDSAKIAASGTPVKVSYTPSAGTVIQALTNSGEEYLVVFSGTNAAMGDAPVVATMFRVKFSPTKEAPFIGDDYASLELSGAILKDETVQGSGVSQFLNIKMAV